MNDTELAATYGNTLVKVAADALRFGLEHNAAPILAVSDYPEALHVPRATFVTLEEDNSLRGCVGSVAARRSLAEDVAANAYAAGFRDPRFRPLTGRSIDHLAVGISILGPFETLACANEEDLFDAAREGVDGFVLSAEGHRGLFLPQVWETLPTKRAFFATLKEKAGLPRNYWSPQLHIERFQVTSIPKQRISGHSLV